MINYIYSTLARAKAACLRIGTRCAGILNYGCKGLNFRLCRIGPIQNRNMGCIYTPMNQPMHGLLGLEFVGCDQIVGF